MYFEPKSVLKSSEGLCSFIFPDLQASIPLIKWVSTNGGAGNRHTCKTMKLNYIQKSTQNEPLQSKYTD